MSVILILLPILISVTLGYLLKEYGFLNEGDKASLTKVLFWVIQPLFLFRTIYGVGYRIVKELDLFAAIHVAYFATLLLVWVLTRTVLNRDIPRKRAISMFSAIRSNNVYLGFPICVLAMGTVGEENASIYLAASIIGFQLLSISAGEVGLSGTTSLKSLWRISRRLVKNPLVIACLSSITLSILWARPLPAFLDKSIEILSAGASGLALIVLGAGIEVKRVSDMLRDTWMDLLVRMIVHPLIMWGVMLLWNVPGEMVKVAVLTSAMPLAVNVYFMSKGMGMDSDYAARLIAATTIAGIAIIPAWMLVLGVA